MTDWLTPGATVAIVSTHPSAIYEETKVERVGKRDVVLANGDRYNVSRLTKTVGGSWGRRYEVVPVDSDQAQRCRDQAAAENRARKRMNYGHMINEACRLGQEARAVELCSSLLELLDAS